MTKTLKQTNIVIEPISYIQIWGDDWTHAFLNGPRLADTPTANLLKRLKAKGDLTNSVLLFFSDHGYYYKGTKLQARIPVELILTKYQR